MFWKGASAFHESSFEHYISSSDCLVGGADPLFAWSYMVGQLLLKMHLSPATWMRIKLSEKSSGVWASIYSKGDELVTFQGLQMED